MSEADDKALADGATIAATAGVLLTALSDAELEIVRHRICCPCERCQDDGRKAVAELNSRAARRQTVPPIDERSRVYYPIWSNLDEETKTKARTTYEQAMLLRPAGIAATIMFDSVMLALRVKFLKGDAS